MQETVVWFLGHEYILEKGWLPTPVFLGFPGGSDGEESSCNAGDLGSIPGLEDPLEKGTTTHSSILAWRIPWTEEPGRLQPMGLQRVGHYWVTFIFTLWQFDIDIHYERISLIKLINTSITSHSYSFFGEMIILDKRTIHQSMNNFFFPHHQVRWNREAYQYTLRRSFKNNFQNAWGIL